MEAHQPTTALITSGPINGVRSLALGARDAKALIRTPMFRVMSGWPFPTPSEDPVNDPPPARGDALTGVNTGWLLIDVSGRMSSSSPLYEYLPKVSIDGGPLLPLGKGPTTFNLPAGHHHLVVGVGSTHTQSFHYGTAPAWVTVLPGQTVTVYYHAPWTSLSRGAIGLVPQKAPGKAVAMFLLTLLAVLMLTGLLVLAF